MDENRFRRVVTESELRDIVGLPNRWLTSKVLPRLDQKCRQFIALSPFVIIGSTGAQKRIDLSPKGDAPGFVHVLDDLTLVLPDRPGNRRIDTFRNVLQDPNVGLIFMVPGRQQTLRVSGLGAVLRNEELRGVAAFDGRTSGLALLVTVQHAFFHCGKCMARSRLWEGSG